MDPRNKKNSKKEASKGAQNQSPNVPARTSGPSPNATTSESPLQASSSGSTSQKKTKSGNIQGGSANVTTSSQRPESQDHSPVVKAPSKVSTTQRPSSEVVIGVAAAANATASSQRPEIQGESPVVKAPSKGSTTRRPPSEIVQGVAAAANKTVSSQRQKEGSVPNVTASSEFPKTEDQPSSASTSKRLSWSQMAQQGLPSPRPKMQAGNVGGGVSSYNDAARVASRQTPPGPSAVPLEFNATIPSIYKPNFTQPESAHSGQSQNSGIQRPSLSSVPAISSTSFVTLVTPKFKGRGGSSSLASTESPAFQPSQHPLPPQQLKNASGDKEPQQGDKLSTSGPEFVSRNPMNVNEQNLNDGYRRLVLRGMDCLTNVTRELLDQFVFNSQYYYDAVLPQKDASAKQPGYTNSIKLDVNMYALSIKVPEFYGYPVQWNPRSIETKTTSRTWKVRLWKKMCAFAAISWKKNSDSDPLPPSYGLGAWSLGPDFFRHDLIPEKVLSNANCNPLELQCIIEDTRGSSSFSTKMRRVKLSIENRPKRIETDMRTLLTKGGDVKEFEKWTRLREALQSIFYMYPAWVKGWIEDYRRLRMFFPTGYPTRGNDPNFLDDTILYPSDFNLPGNDLFVFRRGYRTVPRLFPGGIFVNVWTCFAPFYRSNIMMDYGINLMLKVKLGRPHDGKPLRDLELRWLNDSYMYVRVHTKLTNKIEEYRNPQVYPKRYYRIYGFSRYSCGTLRVPIYVRDSVSGNLTPKQRGMENFLPFCESHYAAAIQKWPDLSFKRLDMKLLALPAVKVHPTLDCYLPPWTLEIKENDKYKMNESGILASFASKMRRALYSTRDSNHLIKFLNTWVLRWIQTDVVLPTFKMTVNPTPLRVTGCLLREPKILTLNLKSGQLQAPVVSKHYWQRGEFGNNAANSMMSVTKSGPCKDYMILHFEQTNPEETYRWFDMFVKSNALPREDFPAFHRRTPYIHNCRAITGVEEFLVHFDLAIDHYRKSEPNSLHPKIIFLFFPAKNTRCRIYDAFKYKCDVELGVMSQVVNLRIWNYMFSSGGNRVDIPMLSMLLKLNKKLGGKNVILRGPFIDEPDMPGTMIFGADVTHSGSHVHHSIAAVVATTDMPPRTYAARVRIQFRNQELIQDIEAMVTELVRLYHRNNPRAPLRRVFFFRDGIGMEQYSELLQTEIPALFNGLNAGGAGSNAKVVYCLGIKRHHTKFTVPTNGGEIMPGTAVNDLPMFPLQTSFYLCTHLHPALGQSKSKMGCCKPSLYHIVLDQLGLLLPELQTLIYHLCYLYEKSSYCLSIVPALHYSHLACSRGRSHYSELVRRDPSIARTFPNTQVPWGANYPFLTRTDIDAHPDVREFMYYL